MPNSKNPDLVTAPLTLARFLSEAPLLTARSVQVSIIPTRNPGEDLKIKLPAISLYCSESSCEGIRFFDPESKSIDFPLVAEEFDFPVLADYLVDFHCRNCRRSNKSFALRISRPGHSEANSDRFDVLKFGELPAFGEQRKNAIKDVLDDDVKFFERGYRAETAGLGIGAFAYYRRFVESHKDRMIAEIRKVAVVQGATQDVLATLDRAAKLNSFENAVKEVKDAIPDSLRHTGGHNPLTLLHSALSAGLHSEDDEQCLELAKDIRLLLTDLAERTAQALKNNGELSQAVTRLLKKATEKSARQNKESDK